MAEVVSEDVGRPFKKRKTVRRRPNIDDGDSSSADTSKDATDAVSTVERVKRPKKYGVPYDNQLATRRSVPEQSSAVVPYERSADAAQSERFVKATGRALVSENAHMSAFIDSKLAEIRSATATPLEGSQTSLPSPQRGFDEDKELVSSIQDDFQPASGKDKGLVMQAIALKKDKNRRHYRKRQPAGPSEADIARDGLVDRILRDGALPLYDKQMPQSIEMDGADDHDKDAAAAAAFKADFLANMEENRYSRKLTNTTTASNGPKLGGSRMARERMKVLEEQAKTTSRSDQ
ncbi:hypothetical protein AMS68_001845 [Peltaster fructicola]|uniref:Uncharacterized protein n=1 Tax=Peltaster fructicola TaxID=286661 RepID=A0A6H0XNX3_9PEZI|nr:hypothetical protein AMS68_001845 [Peltaster fructicola]